MTNEITPDFVESILDGKSAEEWTEFAKANFTLVTITSTLVGFPLLAEAYLEAVDENRTLKLAIKQLKAENKEIKRKNRELKSQNG